MNCLIDWLFVFTLWKPIRLGYRAYLLVSFHTWLKRFSMCALFTKVLRTTCPNDVLYAMLGVILMFRLCVVFVVCDRAWQHVAEKPRKAKASSSSSPSDFVVSMPDGACDWEQEVRSFLFRWRIVYNFSVTKHMIEQLIKISDSARQPGYRVATLSEPTVPMSLRPYPCSSHWAV